MDETLGRQLASKWLKTNALRSHPGLARHIPPTSLYSSAGLRRMLSRHGTVVLKPVRGSGGHGAMKISRQGQGYAFHYMTNTRTFHSFEGLLGAVNLTRRGRPYLIQKGIRLATIDGRPVDYRVKYVKTNGTWGIRAMVGKIARRGLFVTNLCRGGTQVSASYGIRHSLSAGVVGAKKRQMRELTRTATQWLEERFPGIGQLGYDYGIDRNGHIWILEVNTRPH